MKSKLALSLIVYGAFTALVGLLAYRIDPETTRTAFIAAVMGGGLCALWGALGLLMHRGRGWAILTLIATSFALLSQTVVNWMEHEAERAGGLAVPLLITLIFCASVGMVSWLAHAETRQTALPHAVGAH